ncbi:MAG: Na+/H+ antiporter NhaC family protein [Myxococcales bacterium]|nr:MAG: Na+/H+ antiporter NhaC family protein [Myxococcales bacterium]
MTLTRRLAIAAAVVVFLSWALSALPLNEARRTAFTAKRLHEALSQAAGEAGEKAPFDCGLVLRDENLAPLGEALQALGPIAKGEAAPAACSLALLEEGWGYRGEVSRGSAVVFTARTARVQWTALLPPILALALAIATRRVLTSLALGLAVGAALLAVDGASLGPLSGFTLGTAKIVGGVLVNDFRLYIFLFTFSLIGMVNVATASGGMTGLAQWLGRLAKGPRSSQAATALLGAAVFFDDYSNTVIVGSSMRPLTDRARVSREKLAFLVDSTSAPVAGLALISTWIGYEVSLIENAMRELSLPGSAYAMFISTLPYRFYCILLLGFIALNVTMKREFGPMLSAERRARRTGETLRPGSQPLSGSRLPNVVGRPLALNAVLPVLAVIAGVLIGMALNGAGVISPQGFDGSAWAAFDAARLFSLENNYLIACEDGAWVLAMASLFGSALAIALGAWLGRASVLALLGAWFASWRVLLLAFSILILAWSIGDVNGLLGTGAYLVSALADALPAWLLPVLIFLMGAFISFATGTSWGTMAVLLPAAAPLAYHIGGAPLMMVSVGAVLDGSIFGDHSSPLSDTTIMSSISSACDLMDHTRTQLPYALLVAAMAVSAGYLWATRLTPVVSYLAAVAVFALVLRLVGRSPET